MAQEKNMGSAPPPATIPCTQHIGTRDGSLQKDAKMVNCFLEQSENGETAVKRAGTAFVAQVSTNTPQGMLLNSNAPFSIQGDILINITTGFSFAIPSVTVPGQQYSILSDVPYGMSFLKSPSGLWVFNGSVVTKVTSIYYPPLTVSGFVYLDGTYYVMDNTGQVFGSALQDPTTWSSLSVIAADATLGLGAGIIRHLNYLIAFYVSGTQFYYDAGNSPGIALAPVGNASWTTGCAAGASLRETADITFFISRTKQYGRAVSQFEGLSMTKISNPYIERILNLSTLIDVRSFAIKTSGHTFYAITLTDLNVTLVYDVVFGEWHIWSSLVSGVEQYFSCANYLATPTQDLFQDTSTNAIVSMSPLFFTDYTGSIPVLIRTPAYDWGSLRQKRFAAMFLLSDTIPTTVSLRYSDNDYATYSAYRAIDLSTVRKMLRNLGMSRRRSWDIYHLDATPLRLFRIELDLKMMES